MLSMVMLKGWSTKYYLVKARTLVDRGLALPLQGKQDF